MVLRYLHDNPPHNGILSTNWISKQPHPDLPALTEQDVHVAFETLVDEGLVHFMNDSWSSGGRVHWMNLELTGAGLQALGEWPVFDVLSSPQELGQVLDALAEMAPTEEEEANLRQAATVADRLKGLHEESRTDPARRC